MLQKLIEKILGSFKKDQTKDSFPFPLTRPVENTKQEPTIESVNKQELVKESIVQETVITEPPAQIVDTTIVKKTRPKKENGSKTTKRKSK